MKNVLLAEFPWNIRCTESRKHEIESTSGQVNVCELCCQSFKHLAFSSITFLSFSYFYDISYITAGIQQTKEHQKDLDGLYTDINIKISNIIQSN